MCNKNNNNKNIYNRSANAERASDTHSPMASAKLSSLSAGAKRVREIEQNIVLARAPGGLAPGEPGATCGKTFELRAPPTSSALYILYI